MEPQTSSLLMGQYTAEQCRALFPKKPSKIVAQEIKVMMDELDATKNMPPGPERVTKETIMRRKCVMMHQQYQTKGLRIDVQLEDPLTEQEMWVDTICIHPTCQTRIKAEFKHVKKIILAETLARSERKINQLTKQSEKAVINQTNTKHCAYAPLMNVVRKQKLDGKRHNLPAFRAAVVSSLGEFGKELVMLQEWITSCYARKIVGEGHRDDGEKIEDLTAKFRRKFRTAIVVAVARGQARMLNTQGLPAGCIKKVNSDTIMVSPN